MKIIDERETHKKNKTKKTKKNPKKTQQRTRGDKSYNDIVKGWEK